MQGRTLPRLLLNLPRRTRMPWLTAQGLYVMASRVRCAHGLRLLGDCGLENARAQKHTTGLHAWNHGYDGRGQYSDVLAAAAHKQHVLMRARQKESGRR